MANGRSFQGYDERGVVTRYVIEQTSGGYTVYSASRKATSFVWDDETHVGEFPSSQEARESVDTSSLTATEDWYE